MSGGIYQTKKDSVVYQPKWEKTPAIVGAENSTTAHLESKMGLKFPFGYNGEMILGILPKNSELTLIDMTRENSSGLSFIYYYLRVTKSAESQWIGKEVYLLGMTPLDSSETPQFNGMFGTSHGEGNIDQDGPNLSLLIKSLLESLTFTACRR